MCWVVSSHLLYLSFVHLSDWQSEHDKHCISFEGNSIISFLKAVVWIEQEGLHHDINTDFQCGMLCRQNMLRTPHNFVLNQCMLNTTTYHQIKTSTTAKGTQFSTISQFNLSLSKFGSVCFTSFSCACKSLQLVVANAITAHGPCLWHYPDSWQ